MIILPPPLFPPNYISGCLPSVCTCVLRGIRCPTDHAILERTHQTLTAQALLGQPYTSPADLWAGLDEHRAVLNEYLPSRALSHKAPLQAYPHAIHSGRMYRPEWEEDVLCLQNVWIYLQQGRWGLRSRSNGAFALGASSTPSESDLLIDASKFALILIPSRSSVNLKEAKRLFEYQPEVSRKRN